MKIKNIDAGLGLKIASTVLIVVSVIFLVKSVKIYKKYSAAKAFYISELNHRNTLFRRLRNTLFTNPPASVFGMHSVKTYLFTFLSFSNYINYKGYNAVVFLKYPAAKPLNSGLRTAARAVPVQMGSYRGLGSYIVDSKSFFAVKKVSLSLKVKDYASVKTILKIIGDLQTLFPLRIKSILITNKLAVINFNIYGGE